MKKKLNKIWNKLWHLLKSIDDNYFYILMIVIILAMPLISKKHFIGHDTLYHISNIDAIKSDLLNLNFSHISSQISYNLGYGGAIFYPKLPHVFGAIVSLITSIINLNSIHTIKIVQILVILFSGMSMYKLLNEIFKNKNISLLGSAFYITSPYFLAETYVRGALNEFFTFIFMPIILLGIINLFQKKYFKFYIYFILGYIGMMNSHLVLSVYFTILIFIFLLVNIKTIWNKDMITKLIKASCLILIFQMPLIIQMIEHKSLNMYAVFESDIMGSNINSVISNGLRLIDFVIPKINPGNCIYFFISIFVIIFSILGIIYLIIKEKNKITKKVVYGILTFSILSIWLSSKYFPYEILPELLLSIQFAFRCLSFVIFGLSILAAYGLSIFGKEKMPIIIKTTIVLSCIMVLPFINETAFYNADSITYDSVAGMGFQKEYLTINAQENIDYLSKRDQSIIILNESSNKNIEINIIENKMPNLKFEVNNISEDAEVQLELPRLYYLGYDIELINEKEKKTKLDYTYDEYGLIKIAVKEEGIINVKYTGTTLYKVCLIISILTLVALSIYFIQKRLKTEGRGKYNEKRKKF